MIDNANEDYKTIFSEEEAVLSFCEIQNSINIDLSDDINIKTATEITAEAYKRYPA
jgi:hypothetical protein